MSRLHQGILIARSWRTSALLIALFAATLSGCASTDSAGNANSSLDSEEAPTPEPPRIEVWEFANRQGQSIYTEHFRIHTTSDDPFLAMVLPTFCEGALNQYRSFSVFNDGSQHNENDSTVARKRMDTFVFGSRAEWELFTKDLLGHRAAVFVEMGRGGFSTRGTSVLYDVGLQDTLRIVAHEGWHQFVQSRFIDSLPIWLDEGIACCMEASAYHGHAVEPDWKENPDRLRRLASLAAESNPGAFSLEDVLRSEPENMLGKADGDDAVLDYYARVWSLVLFLRDSKNGDHRYRESFERLLADARAGNFRRTVLEESRKRGWVTVGHDQRAFDLNAFRVYFNDDLDEAQHEYQAFLEALIQGYRAEQTTPDD